MTVITPLVAALTTAVLAWIVGTRVTFGWDEVKRQRESDMAALKLFYECYGKFYSAWKLWAVYNRSGTTSGSFPASDPRAWDILGTAEDAEGGFESILVKLASEYAHSAEDLKLFASFRQGYQALRESIRAGRDLRWKAQPTSPRDGSRPNPNRLLEYRQYRAFKALAEPRRWTSRSCEASHNPTFLLPGEHHLWSKPARSVTFWT